MSIYCLGKDPGLVDNYPDLVRQMLWDIVGYTYPKKTWERRLASLTTKDRAKLAKLEEKLHNILEDIDSVIATRAEINKDPWP